MKREAELKSAFSQTLRRRLPTFYTLLLASAGAPDRAIIGAGKTSWLEFKHATPSFRSPGLQELTCMRLAIAGYCRYVIWYETAKGNGQRTMIVHPKVVHERTSWQLTPEAWTMGFDHEWLVEQIRKVHEL